MAISNGTAGAWAATTSRNPTVTLPTHAAGDMLLVRIGWKSATPTTDVAACNTSGWAKIGQFYDGQGASSNGGGGVLVAVFWKVATSSSETDPVIEFDDATSPTPGAYCAVTYTKGAADDWLTPVGDGGAFAASTSISATIQSHVTATAGDMIDAFSVVDDNNVMTVPTFTQSGVTFDTVTEYPATALNSSTSNDISADGCNRLATAGTSSAAAVVTGTQNASDSGASWTTRLRVLAGTTQSGSFNVNAVIKATVTPTGFPINAVIKATQSGELDLDAILATTTAGDFDLDAELLKRTEQSFALDAVILVPGGTTYLIDNFNRTVAAGMGTGDDGLTYLSQSGTRSVNGSALLLTAPTTNGSYAGGWRSTPTPPPKMVFAEIRVRFTGGLEDAGDTFHIGAGVTAVGAPWVSGAAVLFSRSGASYSISGVYSSTNAWSTDSDPKPYIVGDWWLVKGFSWDTGGLALQNPIGVKKWKEGDTEPVSFYSSGGTTQNNLNNQMIVYGLHMGSDGVSAPSGEIDYVRIYGRNVGFISLDSWIAGRFALDAEITAEASHFHIDAIIAKTQAGDFDIDAILLATIPGDFDLDAILLASSGTLAFDLDAVLKKTQASNFPLDTAFFATISSSLALGAEIAVKVFEDTFERTVAVGWGTSSWGTSWTELPVYGGDAQFVANEVNGSEAVQPVFVPGDYVGRAIHYGMRFVPYGVIQFDFWAQSTPTGWFWYQVGTETFYIRLTPNNANGTTYTITTAGAYTTDWAPPTRGAWYTVKTTLPPTNGVRNYLKVWKRGDPEPNWQWSALYYGHADTYREGYLEIDSGTSEVSKIDNIILWSSSSQIGVVDAFPITAVKRKEQPGSFALDAALVGVFSLDAILLANSGTKTFPIDALLAATVTQGFALDAVLLRTTFSSLVEETDQGNHSSVYAGFGYTGSTTRVAQGFTPRLTGSVSAVTFTVWVSPGSVPSDSLIIEIQSDSGGVPSGTVIGTCATVLGNTLPRWSDPIGNALPLTFSFSPISVSEGVLYHFVLRRSSGSSASTQYGYLAFWEQNIPGEDPYVGGRRSRYSGSWSGDSEYDIVFSAAVASLTAPPLTADAILFATTSGEIALDATLAATIPGDFSLDAVLLANSGTKTFPLDAEIVAGSTTVPGDFPLDAIIAATATGEIDLDAVISREQTGSFALDAVLSTTTAGEIDLDALLAATQPGSFSVAAIIGKTIIAAPRSALIESVGGNLPYIIHLAGLWRAESFPFPGGFVDSLTYGVVRVGEVTDSLVVEVRADNAGLPSDVVLAVEAVDGATLPDMTPVRREVALGAYLPAGTYWLSFHRTASVLGAYYIEGSAIDVDLWPDGEYAYDIGSGWTLYPANDLYLKVALRTGPSVDAVIAATATGALVLDAVLAKAQTGSLTVAAVILASSGTKAFTLDAILLASSGTLTFPVDATLLRTQEGSFPVAAIVSATTAGEIDLDAVIGTTTAWDFDLDAILLAGSGTKAFALDAWIITVATGEISLDAVISATISPTGFPVDAWVAGTGVFAFALDAILLATIPGNVPADAVITATVAGTPFALDAMVSTTTTGEIDLDAILLATIPGATPVDAIARATTSGAFAADAVVRATPSSGLTIDAIVTRTQEGSLALDAILAATQSGELDLDAILLATIPGSVAVDGVVRREATGFLSADAIVLREQQGSLTTAAIVAKTQAGVVALDAVILRTQTGAVALDAVIAASSGTLAFVLDALVLRTTSGEIDLDAEIVAGTVASSFALDAILLRTTEGNFPVEAWVAGSGVGAFGVSAILLATATGDADLDAVITATSSGDLDLDAVLSATAAGSFAVEAVLAATANWTLVLDAILAATQTGEFFADAVVARAFTGSVSLDAVIRTEQSGVPFALDAVLLASSGTKSVTLDALIVATSTFAIPLDALVLATGTGSFPLDAWIPGSGLGAFTIDAVLATTQSGELDLDAILATTTAGDFDLDALVRYVGTGSVLLDAVIAATVGSAFDLDAEIETGIREGSFSVQAIVSRSASATFSVDAVVAETSSGSFPIDAVQLKTATQAVPLDAVAGATRMGGYATDAVLLSPQSGSLSVAAELVGGFRLDAWLVGQHVFVLDASISRKIAQEIEATVSARTIAATISAQTIEATTSARTIAATVYTSWHPTRQGTLTLDAEVA